MTPRGRIGLGMAAGLAWAVAVVFGTLWLSETFLPPPLALPGALVPPGLVMAAMIARIGNRRFLTDDLIDGQRPAPGTPAEIDARVLANTVEQAVLALLIWPFVALTLGGALVIAMGVAFALARLAFWWGYHRAPPARAFGFAATFYTTMLAGLWAVVVWL